MAIGRCNGATTFASWLSRTSREYNEHMRRLIKRRVLHAWIAFLAILFSALAPSISHALATGVMKAGSVEICTSAGVKIISVTGSSGPADTGVPAAHGFEHCPFCATHADSFALPPSLTVMVGVVEGHDGYPPLFYNAPRRLHSWSPGAARAPPAFV